MIYIFQISQNVSKIIIIIPDEKPRAQQFNSDGIGIAINGTFSKLLEKLKSGAGIELY